jgi:hypothetical protein
MGGKCTRQWLFSAIFRRFEPDEPAEAGEGAERDPANGRTPIEPR